MAPGDRRSLRHPAQYVALTFAGAAVAGTALLLLPVSSQGSSSTSVLDAFFTATSAVCVTGLTVVDTGTHWSGFGQWVIMALIQVGGLGIMTLSSLIILTLSRRLGLRQRIVVASATGSVSPGELRTLLRGVVSLTVTVQSAVALVLFVRFWHGHDVSVGRSLYLAVFHAVSAFNNAGFALWADNLEGFQRDNVLLLAAAAAVIAGGLGFPVWVQLARHRMNVRAWSLHTKLTVTTTVGLLIIGWVVFLWFEWSNPGTIGDLPAADSATNGLFQTVSFRTAGFASMDMGQLQPPTQLAAEVLMFIGGGSASTAGGIKVTTFALLGWVMWAEARGDPDVVVFERRIPTAAQRQAVTVALMAVGVVVASTMLLLATSDLPRSDLMFEAISALGTVGLSTGITADLSGTSQVIVMVLMYLGRIGPPTLFAALVLREREREFRYPEERPIVG